MLIELKSRGKDLDRAYKQAKDSFPGIKDRDLPHYLLVSDFARFRLYDLEEDAQHEFPLKDLYKYIRLFGFTAGYQTTSYQEQDPVNLKAAERMGLLHDRLEAIGYTGHELEVYLVRLLFCLFAEDTGIFERRQFQDLIEQRIAADGQDLAQWLHNLFEVLDTPPDLRITNLDKQLAAFQYVDGNLLLNGCAPLRLTGSCGTCSWSVAPSTVPHLPGHLRRAGSFRHGPPAAPPSRGPLHHGKEHPKAHQAAVPGRPAGRIPPGRAHRKRLAEFHQRLANLKFLDPACGCGNFLVIANRILCAPSNSKSCESLP